VATRRSTKSDSPVAARDQLAAQEPADQRQALEGEAKEQEAQQRQELKQGSSSSAAERGYGQARQAEIKKGNVVGGWKPGQKAVNGFMDQISTNGDEEALEGHFCVVDTNHKGVPDELKANGDAYGVYLEPGAINPETGKPETVVFRARSATNQRYVVPYEALSPAESGGRRA
jgi:hypothetical protein